MTGTCCQWDTALGQHRETIDIPGVWHQDLVFDGARGWIRDVNGKVHEVSGAGLERLFTNAYVGSFSWLVRGRMPGEASIATEDSSSVALDIRPVNGQPYSAFIDKTSNLPIRLEQSEGSRQQTTWFFDWREVEGVRFPWRILQTSGDPRFEVTLSVAHIELNARFDDLFRRLEETAAPASIRGGRKSAEFAFELYGAHILVPVLVNGKGPLGFILDTGADASAIDRDRARTLGIPLQGAFEGRGLGGSAEVGVASDVLLGLPGGIEVQCKAMASFSDTRLAAVLGRLFDGIIGYDVISRFVMRIDYEKRLLTLHLPPEYEYHGTGVSLPLTYSANHISVAGVVELEGGLAIDVLLTVDTGSGDAIAFNAPFIGNHRLLDHIPNTIAGSGYGFGGPLRERIGRLPSLRIGPYAILGAVARFALPESIASPEDRPANLGGEILRRFTVIVDYARGRMILEPNSCLEDPFEYDMSGLELVSSGADLRKIVVHGVREASPAQEAGVEPGDLLTEIDGVDSSTYLLPKVRDRLRTAPGAVDVAIERKGRRYVFKIRLRRLI
jgi:hypothetical protein